MFLGIYSIELHLPEARSLKDRRQVVRRLKDRLRARYNLSIVEIESETSLRQRAGLMIVSVANTKNRLESLFETVFQEAESLVPGYVSETGLEIMEGCDGGIGGWQGELP